MPRSPRNASGCAAGPGLLVMAATTLLMSWVLPVTMPVALGSDMKRAHSAMQVAKAYKRQGDLRRAEHMFGIVIENAPEESNIRFEAQDELDYYLPLIRVERALLDGNGAAAEKILLDLQQAFEDQPKRREEIDRILAGIKGPEDYAGNPVPSNSEVDERLAAKKVNDVLAKYYKENNRYPASRSALADVLPLDQPPLNAFDVERYSGDGFGFVLVLRSKNETGQRLTLQRTGLLQ